MRRLGVQGSGCTGACLCVYVSVRVSECGCVSEAQPGGGGGKSRREDKGLETHWSCPPWRRDRVVGAHLVGQETGTFHVVFISPFSPSTEVSRM